MAQDPGLTPGDPLGGERPAPTWQPPEAPGSVSYTSPPPPGAGGPAWGGTAAPVAGQWVLSGWWRRVGAALIDGAIVGSVTVLLSLLIIVPIVSGLSNTVAIIIGALLVVLCIAIVVIFYAPVMMARTNGKTVGRMATGIRVVRANRQPIAFGFALLREVVVKVLLFSLLPAVLHLLDALWPLWDEENRALHDLIVNTRVIRD